MYVSADCPGDLVCARDGQCRDACQSDGECLPGAKCLKGTCANVESEGIGDDSPLQNDEAGGLTATCKYNSDCIQPLACRNGVCEPACVTDVDCPSGKQCVVKDVPGLGSVKSCEGPTTTDPNLPAHCSDGLAGTGESGLDCGGECGKCPPGEGCAVDGDCLQQVCTASVCAAPICGDGKKNGDETGIDCGGTQCAGAPPCPVCTGPSDCAPGESCDLASGLCEGPGCLDGIQNGGETGPDCGGPCSPCDPGVGCLLAGDCASQVCLGGVCRAASCSDNVQNQGESAVDCGGTGNGCARCGVGASCTGATDCTSGVCTSGTCAAPTCGDGVQNGLELAPDCGVAAGCPGCDPGASALGLAGTLALGACHDAEILALAKALGEGCLLASDCEPGLTCVYGRCHPECNETRDCRELGLPFDTTCSIGEKPDHVCLLEDEVACPASPDPVTALLLYPHGDCPPGMRCAPDEQCRDACTAPGDCLAGQVCLKGVCADPAAENLPADSELLDDEARGPGATCSYASECVAPLECLGGLCDTACVADVDCADGQQCVAIVDASSPLSGTMACRSDDFDPNAPEHCGNFAHDAD